MHWRQLFLDFRGRISRTSWWTGMLMLLGATLAVGVTGALLLAAAGGSGGLGFTLLTATMVLATIYPAYAVTVKRLHDRGKSAWWLIPFYVLPGAMDAAGTKIGGEDGVLPLSIAAMALGLWALVDLGFLPGTPGPNAYGPDPLGAGLTDATL